MNLNFPFSSETRNLFLYVFSCFKCGRSDRGLELHHIVGRKSDSMLNACPLCKDCHAHIGHTNEEEQELFFATFHFLSLEDVPLHQKDVQFMRDFSYLVINNQALNQWHKNN